MGIHRINTMSDSSMLHTCAEAEFVLYMQSGYYILARIYRSISMGTMSYSMRLHHMAFIVLNWSSCNRMSKIVKKVINCATDFSAAITCYDTVKIRQYNLSKVRTVHFIH